MFAESSSSLSQLVKAPYFVISSCTRFALTTPTSVWPSVFEPQGQLSLSLSLSHTTSSFGVFDILFNPQKPLSLPDSSASGGT